MPINVYRDGKCIDSCIGPYEVPNCVRDVTKRMSVGDRINLVFIGAFEEAEIGSDLEESDEA